MKKKFTVCLYDGSVLSIGNIVATKIVEEETMDSFNHIALFYDIIEQGDGYTEYRNRITKRDFKVYYERSIHISDEIQTYDFGSYSRFIGIFEGEHQPEDLQKLIAKKKRRKTWEER